MDEGHTDELVFFAFDLLLLNGERTAQLPLIQRGAATPLRAPLQTVSIDAIFCEREISFLLMPNSADPAQILEEVLGEADALIRRLLEERGVEVPHLVIAATLEGQVVLRSNVSSDALRSFGEELINNLATWR